MGTILNLRKRLMEGMVIPAHPLALTSHRKLDERRQRALTRYYLAAGAGGVALGVHTTQFEIHDAAVGLYRPVLELAVDDLVPYAHWITPVDRPKRFDTHFFLAPAAPDQIAVHDGREAVDAIWTTPDAVLRGADEKRIKLVFATRMNLLKLARSKTVADALAAARGTPVVTVTPVIEKTSAGPFIHIPEAAGYGATRIAAGDIPRA